MLCIIYVEKGDDSLIPSDGITRTWFGGTTLRKIVTDFHSTMYSTLDLNRKLQFPFKKHNFKLCKIL